MSEQSLIQLKELIGNLPKSKILAGASLRDGKYKFYLSGKKVGRIDAAISNKDAIIMGDGGVASIGFAKGNYSYSSHNFGFFSKNKNVETKYLYRALENFLPVIDYQGFKGSGIKNIDKNFLFDLYIQIPPLSEQKKITSILTSVDELIEKTQLKIDKLQDLKKATMYEFFINHIAKTGLKDNRKSFLLSNLVSRIRTIENNEVKNILTISSTRGWLDQSERWSRKMAGESLKKYTKLKKGDFSYNRGNSKTFPYGCIFRMDKWDEAVVPNVYHSFEITNTQVDSNYLQQYFWSGALDKQLRKVLTSSARDDGLLNITADTFFSLNVDLPSLSEQKKVASILTSMDKNIDDKKQKLTQIQFLKKSLMQDLLTGKVRVKVN